MRLTERTRDFLDLPLPIVVITLAFAMTGIWLTLISVRAIRSGEVTIYRSSVRFRGDKLSYLMNLGLTLVAGLGCFVVAHLLFKDAPGIRRSNLNSTETLNVETQPVEDRR